MQQPSPGRLTMDSRADMRKVTTILLSEDSSSSTGSVDIATWAMIPVEGSSSTVSTGRVCGAARGRHRRPHFPDCLCKSRVPPLRAAPHHRQSQMTAGAGQDFSQVKRGNERACPARAQPTAPHSFSPWPTLERSVSRRRRLSREIPSH